MSPYIPKGRRDEILNKIDSLPQTPGELNYLITLLILSYLKLFPRSYCKYNEVIGVLECVKQEVYRRLIVPYEEKKRKENGDVF